MRTPLISSFFWSRSSSISQVSCTSLAMCVASLPRRAWLIAKMRCSADSMASTAVTALSNPSLVTSPPAAMSRRRSAWLSTMSAQWRTDAAVGTSRVSSEM